MKKRILAALVSASLVLSGAPSAFAASDISGHWAEKYITYLNQEGVINASATTGEYSPSAKVTRAEFMRYINRAFHFTETADISYADVKSKDWYYETVQIASKYGYIAGVGDNKMDPNGFVTREQAATIIGRLYKTTTPDKVAPAQLSFTDKSKINIWSAGYIHEAVQKGYIVGYPDGTFLPRNTVTRAEIMRILYSYLGNSLSQGSKDYTGLDFRNDVENVTISEGCTLSSAEIGGDLYITEGLGSNRVVLSNVSVNGMLIISGGSVTLDNVDAPTIIVGSSMNRLVQVTATGRTNIANTEVQSTALLTETALDVSSSGFSDVDLKGSESTTLTLASDIWDLDMQSKSAVALSSSAAINTLNMRAGGTVTGYGSIGTANISGAGANLGIQPGTYNLSSGITAIINGKNVKSTTAIAISPDTLSWDRGTSTKLENSYDFTFSPDPNTLSGITLNGKALQDGTDYRIIDHGVRIYRTFLNSISGEGTYTLELTFNSGDKARLTLNVTDSSKSTISSTQATFDKYPASANYDDVSFTIKSAAGVQLSGVKVASVPLKRGEEYTYNASTGLVTIKASYLSARSAGQMTASFLMTGGNDLSALLTIEDTTPINKLSATKMDFNANSSGDDYEDLVVTLEPANNATLKSILAIGPNKTLEENWQYTAISDNQIRISKAALTAFAKDSRQYVDLRFQMTSGVNPVLRVNYVTTYPVLVNVTDVDGLPIRDASVTLKPNANTQNNESASEAQEKLTDSGGLATFYVKKGSYSALIQGDRFENSSKDFLVTGYSQKVNFQVAIQEEVVITVTESSGAKVNGALVMLGSQTQTTREDGTVTFTIPRGAYLLSVSSTGYQTYTETYKVANSIPKRVQLSR